MASSVTLKADPSISAAGSKDATILSRRSQRPAQAQPSQPYFPFELPAELRLMVYDHALIEPAKHSVLCGGSGRIPSLAIFYVSKQVYKEVKRHLFSSVHVKCHICHYGDTLQRNAHLHGRVSRIRCTHSIYLRNFGNEHTSICLHDSSAEYLANFDNIDLYVWLDDKIHIDQRCNDYYRAALRRLIPLIDKAEKMVPGGPGGSNIWWYNYHPNREGEQFYPKFCWGDGVKQMTEAFRKYCDWVQQLKELANDANGVDNDHLGGYGFQRNEFVMFWEDDQIKFKEYTDREKTRLARAGMVEYSVKFNETHHV